jgi:hypothetical protein
VLRLGQLHFQANIVKNVFKTPYLNGIMLGVVACTGNPVTSGSINRKTEVQAYLGKRQDPIFKIDPSNKCV